MANFERTATTSTTTSTSFLAPTLRAVEMRIKAEVKRNPLFETADAEIKNRAIAMAEPIFKMLSDLEGYPQETVDAIISSEEFWSAMSCSIKVNNTATASGILTAIRNIIADLCA